MDKIAIIEQKLENYFKSQISLKNRINLEDLTLSALVIGKDLAVKLHTNNDFKDVELSDVLKLSVFESLVTSNEAIKQVLISGIKNNNGDQLIIKSNKTYFIAYEGATKQITINQIIE